MKIVETFINGLYVLEPRVFEDARGYFFESYNKKLLSESGINYSFVQDNQSKSQYGVIRGLHYQKEPHPQTKLVRVLAGKIYDVAVDLRSGSETYSQWFGEILSADNKKQMIIPRGFAHGFSVLSEETIVLYKCDDYYYPETEAGIKFNDPQLTIDWKIKEELQIVSDKDQKLPLFDPSIHVFK